MLIYEQQINPLETALRNDAQLHLQQKCHRLRNVHQGKSAGYGSSGDPITASQALLARLCYARQVLLSHCEPPSAPNYMEQ